MEFIQQKVQLRGLLAARDIDAVLKWAADNRNPLRRFISLTYDADELISWRAIEAVGKVAGYLAEADIEKIRDTIRRLLWLMSDESGGLGWHSPEIIGEILVNVPNLISEYGPLLPAYFVEEPFERGTYLAVSRTVLVNPIPYCAFVSGLKDGLNNEGPIIRALAGSALSIIGNNADQQAVDKLIVDTTGIRLYNFDSGQLEETTVGNLVKESCKNAQTGKCDSKSKD